MSHKDDKEGLKVCQKCHVGIMVNGLCLDCGNGKQGDAVIGELLPAHKINYTSLGIDTGGRIKSAPSNIYKEIRKEMQHKDDSEFVIYDGTQNTDDGDESEHDGKNTKQN